MGLSQSPPLAGDSVLAKISTATDYPFGETIRLKVEPASAVACSLYFRISGWRKKYALDRDARQHNAGITVERKPMPAHWDWSLDAPVVLKLPARAIDWKPTDAQALPDEPVTGTAAEIIRLVPYGCTKFRISMFPVTARAWAPDPARK